MAKRDLPSPDVLRQLLRYEPETGKLFWRERKAGSFPNPGTHASWNVRFADKEAFTAHIGQHRRGTIGGVNLLAHRVAWAMHYGSYPVGFIDHINGDGSDNRIANLRMASNAENLRNRGATSISTSLRKGVTWNKVLGKWQAQIKANYKNRYLGVFDCLDAAAAAYDAAALEVHGAFAKTNEMAANGKATNSDKG